MDISDQIAKLRKIGGGEPASPSKISAASEPASKDDGVQVCIVR